MAVDFAASQAVAEEAANVAPVGQVEEVIVTARKRNETDISVPAVVTALSADKLTRQGANTVYALAQLTPTLIVGQNAASLGGSIVMRGVGSGALNGVEQTVAINVDGIAVSNAGSTRLGYFDLKQVEVLKGPQALFFGKNSPGGVISFRSADPTSTLSGYVRTEYEVNAREWRAEGAVAGPIAGALSGRLAVFVDDMQGYFKNPLPDNYAPNVYGPNYHRAPNRTEYGGRLTLKYAPTDALDATLKIAYVNSKGSPSHGDAQLGYCPTGAPQVIVARTGVYPGDCIVNNTVAPLGDASPAARAALPRIGNGKVTELNSQFVSSLNVDYHLTPNLTLTSVTGLYDYLLKGFNTQVGPMGDYVLVYDSHKRDASQEVRLSSNFDGPFDFMLGGFYQRSVFHYDGQLYNFGPAPFNAANYKLPSQAWSAFGQLTYRIRDDLELSGGARYTTETKRARVSLRFTGDVTSRLPRTEIKVEDVSPEVTLTYRPTTDFTAFVAYKEGFKSGGFNPSIASGVPAGVDIAYGPENVHGLEAGVKTRLLDRAMRLDLSVYQYHYGDLQVSAYDPSTLRVFVQNAASAKVEGVEASLQYNPPEVPGLNIDAGLAYNHARFEKFIGACYTGQTIAAGCNLLPLSGRFTSQNLTGRPLPSAPDWSGNLNVSYDMAAGANHRVEVGVGARYVSSYNPAGDFAPGGLQKAAIYWDARARVYATDGKWDLALIGRNLNDELRAQSVFGQVSTGTASGLPTGTPSDLAYFVNRPWEVRLQLTLRPAFLNP